jgi:hypothetical protein
MSEPAPELRQVRLLNLPVQLWVHAKQHNDELLREFTLIATAEEGLAEVHAVPERLITVITTLRQQYGQGSSERDARIFAAHEAGTRHLDMVVELPATAVPALRNLAELLDDADEFCRSGQHLLTLATPPELVAYRRWYLRELALQLEGAVPTPWSESSPQP